MGVGVPVLAGGLRTAVSPVIALTAVPPISPPYAAEDRQTGESGIAAAVRDRTEYAH